MTPADTTLPQRLSPLHDELDHLHPQWGRFHGMPVALSIKGANTEADRALLLGLADVSAFRRITLKGPNALALLKELGVVVPEDIFGVARQDQGGIAARTGGAEFFVEDGFGTDWVDKIIGAVGPLGGKRPGVYPVLRADASILITGKLATEVFAQTCGVDMRTATPDRLIYTRVAGVSCSILAREFAAPSFQLWADNSYGLSLWESLVEIASELGGGPVGWSVVFPSLPALTP